MTGVLLVTGGGRGIGAATCMLAAKVCSPQKRATLSPSTILRTVLPLKTSSPKSKTGVAMQSPFKLMCFCQMTSPACSTKPKVAEENIRVVAVSPGLTETEIHARSTGEPGRIKRMSPMIPLQRAGTAEEIAQTIMFALSDAASYITATTIRVAGGR